MHSSVVVLSHVLAVGFTVSSIVVVLIAVVRR